ncbi:MAG: zinc metallopeptidase [Chromatiaceae bacterium]|nr:zinc metallopeptidase [Chromatiaceae bacterium]
MRWRSGRRSSNIEDRRDRVSTGVPSSSRRRRPVGRRTATGGGLGLVAIVLLALVFGIDPSTLMSVGLQVPESVPSAQSFPGATNDPFSTHLGQQREDELADFVAVVLADTEDIWQALFNEAGGRYREPNLVLFTGSVRSACGMAGAAMGPFYCPADEKVYIDLGFYDELQNRYQAPGDFAQAYVIAHEVGHHVQNLLGISDQVSRAQQQAGKVAANRLSVMLELQADCFAGVWANRAQQARQILERGDIDEGLNAAAQIGDDRMQRRAGGFVVPDSFTHGSAEQRQRWFRTGLSTGDIERCNTFEAASL